MKNIMSAALGLSLVLGSAFAAQDPAPAKTETHSSTMESTKTVETGKVKKNHPKKVKSESKTSTSSSSSSTTTPPPTK